MDKISIFIVDDHQIVIDGLKALLDDIEDFTIVGFSTQSKKVTQMLATLSADVLLTDVMMPEMNGQALAKQIRTQFPDMKILALSMSGAGEIVDEMINNADINGYVLKNIGKAELETAIRKIAGGGIYFGEEILTELEKTSKVKKESEEAQLTNREIEIIRLIEKEYSNRDIAESLFISERTVETHRKNIFRKTKTSGVIGLVKYAYEHRLIG
jgi:DNA-binding NarL/FixJ family response regulator